VPARPVEEDFPTELHRSAQIRGRDTRTVVLDGLVGDGYSTQGFSRRQEQDSPCLICADLCGSVEKFLVAVEVFRERHFTVDYGNFRKCERLI
jgi:hypothetical protein